MSLNATMLQVRLGFLVILTSLCACSAAGAPTTIGSPTATSPTVAALAPTEAEPPEPTAQPLRNRLADLNRGKGRSVDPSEWLTTKVNGSTVGVLGFEAEDVGNDWIQSIVQVANNGPRSVNLYGKLELQDQRNRLYDILGAADYPPYTATLRALQDGRYRGSELVTPITDVQAGRFVLMLAMFHVAEDSEDLHFTIAR